MSVSILPHYTAIRHSRIMCSTHSTLLVKHSALISLYFDGARQYHAAAAIGLVALADSSEVVLCALTTHESFPTLLSASLATFSESVKLDTTHFALFSNRGMVCVSFRDETDMTDFAGAYECARASVSADSGNDMGSTTAESSDADESLTYSLMASCLATMDGDWDLL